MTAVRTELLYEVTMDAETDDLGETPLGHRRIVRVTGGSFEGPKLRGTVLPRGGDWLVERRDGVRALDVRRTPGRSATRSTPSCSGSRR